MGGGGPGCRRSPVPLPRPGDCGVVECPSDPGGKPGFRRRVTSSVVGSGGSAGKGPYILWEKERLSRRYCAEEKHGKNIEKILKKCLTNEESGGNLSKLSARTGHRSQQAEQGQKTLKKVEKSS